jgi:Amt family ammonium transporter
MEQVLKSLSRSRLLTHAAIWGVVALVISVAAMSGIGTESVTYDAAVINTGDTAWMLVATALVMLMTPAVGFFYGGMVSAKNVISVLQQSFLILALISVQWVLIGYTLAFGPTMGGFIGDLSYLGLAGVGFAPLTDYAATIPGYLFVSYQAMFAIVTPALIIGAFVGRMRFVTLIVFTLLWTTLVYDPIAHWVWAVGGWLRTLGALDFAGGAVVHMSAGFGALAAAMLIGKRAEATHPAETANNVPFVILGAALLWFGWFGFNAGSALGAGALAASAFLTTNTAAAAAALVWVALSYVETKKFSALAAATGAVCGLVTITPAAGFVSPLSAIVIGLIGGIVTFLAVHIRTNHIAIDDTLDAWAAHGIGGLTGAILTGVFAEKAINGAGNNGALFGDPYQLVTQLIVVAVTALYAFAMTWLIIKGISYFMPLRVSEDEESEGLDMSVHGEAGYRI